MSLTVSSTAQHYRCSVMNGHVCALQKEGNSKCTCIDSPHVYTHTHTHTHIYIYLFMCIHPSIHYSLGSALVGVQCPLTRCVSRLLVLALVSWVFARVGVSRLSLCLPYLGVCHSLCFTCHWI